MSRPAGPVDRLVDLVVFAPLGLALRARDELPKLAAYGRERFTAQAGLARMVGQMTVAQARRQLDSMLTRQPSDEPASGPASGERAPSGPVSGERAPSGPATGPVPQPSTSPTTEPAGTPVPIRDLGPDDAHPMAAGDAVPAPPPPHPGDPTAGAEPPPAVADLPIPGYDSLSASQVVQRLPGLSRDELEAVRAYEQAGRKRQTILLRVAQLKAAS